MTWIVKRMAPSWSDVSITFDGEPMPVDGLRINVDPLMPCPPLRISSAATPRGSKEGDR